jgi:hypothetical protein
MHVWHFMAYTLHKLEVFREFAQIVDKDTMASKVNPDLGTTQKQSNFWLRDLILSSIMAACNRMWSD